MLASILGAEVVAITRGGARLAEFSNEKTRTGQRVREALSSGGFDLVIMQDMSHLAATNPAAHVRSVAAMSKLAKSYDASTLLYGTWGYQIGCPRLEKLGMTAEEMCELMSVGGRQAADAACVPLVDMASVAADMRSQKISTLRTGFIQAKPALCSLRTVLQILLRIYLPLDEAPRALWSAGHRAFSRSWSKYPDSAPT